MPVDAGAVIAVIVCVASAATASGLTQGYLSLESLELNIKLRSGTDEEKKQAKVLLPIIERHHLLLVCLMLWNAAANEILPIYLSKLVSPVVAVIISVTVILFIGEIIPAALCTGKDQLWLTYTMAPLMYFVFVVFYIIAAPIAWCLDYTLGAGEGLTTYNKMELSAMIKIQQEEAKKKMASKGTKFSEARANSKRSKAKKSSKTSSSGKLGVNGTIEFDEVPQDADEDDEDGFMQDVEVGLMDGVLKFGNYTAKDVMNASVFMLGMDVKLNSETFKKIFQAGYSRFPVYEGSKNNIKGVVLAKDLICLDPADEVPMLTFFNLFQRPVFHVGHKLHLNEVLAKFQRKGGHLAIVNKLNSVTKKVEKDKDMLGIITIEDIFSKIMGKDSSGMVIADLETRRMQKNRDGEIARMQLLNQRLHGSENRLTSEEVKAVCSYLQGLTQIQQLVGNDAQALYKLVGHSSVVDAKRKSTSPKDLFDEDLLFRRGEVCNSVILVLTGSVKVLAGKDQYPVLVGPWTALGKDIFVLEENMYRPEFSAYLDSPEVRYLKMSKPGTASAVIASEHATSNWQKIMSKSKAKRAPGLMGLIMKAREQEAVEAGVQGFTGLKKKVPMGFLRQAIIKAAAEKKAAEEATERALNNQV